MALTSAIAGIVDKPSNHSVDETVEKRKNIFQSRGVTLFALVGHSGEARKVGMKIAPYQVIDLWQPEGWGSAHACLIRHRH